MSWERMTVFTKVKEDVSSAAGEEMLGHMCRSFGTNITHLYRLIDRKTIKAECDAHEFIGAGRQ